MPQRGHVARLGLRGLLGTCLAARGRPPGERALPPLPQRPHQQRAGTGGEQPQQRPRPGVRPTVVGHVQVHLLQGRPLPIHVTCLEFQYMLAGRQAGEAARAASPGADPFGVFAPQPESIPAHTVGPAAQQARRQLDVAIIGVELQWIGGRQLDPAPLSAHLHPVDHQRCRRRGVDHARRMQCEHIAVGFQGEQMRSGSNQASIEHHQRQAIIGGVQPRTASLRGQAHHPARRGGP